MGWEKNGVLQSILWRKKELVKCRRKRRVEFYLVLRAVSDV